MRHGTRRGLRGARLLAGLLAVLAASEAVAAAVQSPASPVDILNRRDLEAPFLDAVPICVPEALEGLFDRVVEMATAGQW